MAKQLTVAWEPTDKKRFNAVPNALLVQPFDILINVLTTP
jgi:hypothetical protein